MMGWLGASHEDDEQWQAWHKSISQRASRALAGVAAADFIFKFMGLDSRFIFLFGWKHGKPNFVLGMTFNKKAYTPFLFVYSCMYEYFNVANKQLHEKYPDCEGCIADKKREVAAQERVIDKDFYEKTGKHIIFDHPEEDKPDDDDQQPVAVVNEPGPKEPEEGGMMRWR